MYHKLMYTAFYRQNAYNYRLLSVVVWYSAGISIFSGTHTPKNQYPDSQLPPVPGFVIYKNI